MAPTLLLRAGFLGLMLAGGPALAEDIDQLPVTATFVISGGSWEGDAETPASTAAVSPTPARRPAAQPFRLRRRALLRRRRAAAITS